MNATFEDYEHPERDHSLLARSLAKAMEMFVDDAWAWAEREVVELKARVAFADVEHITGASRVRINVLGGSVEEIRLKRLPDAVNQLTEQINRIKDEEYSDPSHAFALIQAYMLPMLEMIRQLLGLRAEINAIREAFRDQE